MKSFATTKIKVRLIANPHTYILEDGGMKQVDMVQVNFKAEVDPYGLLNPGKNAGLDGTAIDFLRVPMRRSLDISHTLLRLNQRQSFRDACQRRALTGNINLFQVQQWSFA